MDNLAFSVYKHGKDDGREVPATRNLLRLDPKWKCTDSFGLSLIAKYFKIIPLEF